MDTNFEHFKDVNKDDYLKAMFTEVLGEKNMIDFSQKSKQVYNLIMNKPSNPNGKLSMTSCNDNLKNISTVDSLGRGRDKDGYIVISHSSLLSDSFMKKAKKIIKKYKNKIKN